MLGLLQVDDNSRERSQACCSQPCGEVAGCGATRHYRRSGDDYQCFVLHGWFVARAFTLLGPCRAGVRRPITKRMVPRHPAAATMTSETMPSALGSK
jgi:hypothetical protein